MNVIPIDESEIRIDIDIRYTHWLPDCSMRVPD